MMLEDLGALDAFLNASMLLSGMGPLHNPSTTAGKVFAALFALYSGFAVLGIAGIIFAPVVHRVFHRFHIPRRTRSRTDGQDTPSSSSSRPLLAAIRIALGFSYSGESYHAFAASIDGNSMITRRRCGQSPSKTWTVAAPVKELAAELGDGAGNELRVLLVALGIGDLDLGEQVSGHAVLGSEVEPAS
jgi:hypothetical protein